MTKNMTELTALELGAAIRAGEITVTEATKQLIEKIKTEDEKYHAYTKLPLLVLAF